MATQYTAGLTTGQVLTAATMNTIGAAWESYTPSLTQSGNVTKTVTYAKYTQINKLCICNVRLDVTGTGTAGSNLVVGLPLTASVGAGLRIGSGVIYDASAAVAYAAIMNTVSSTTISFVGDWSGANSWGSSPNIAIANTDQVSFSIMYEVV